MSRFAELASVLVLANHMDGFLGPASSNRRSDCKPPSRSTSLDCRAKTPAPLPAVTVETPFGQRIHALAIYLKTRQALSYERLQQACSDLFDLTIKPAWLIWARDVAYGLEASEDPKFPSGSNSGSIACSLSPSILPAWRNRRFTPKKRELERQIDDILTASTSCSIARELIGKIARARESSCSSFAHSPAKSSRPTRVRASPEARRHHLRLSRHVGRRI